MPANLGNPSDSFAPPCRHSRESGNPVPLPALDRKAESSWVPAFAGRTIKVEQANHKLDFRSETPSHQHTPPRPKTERRRRGEGKGGERRLETGVGGKKKKNKK